jgi:hypothetical protein
MNPNIPFEIQEKFKCLEFRGRPFKQNNKTLVECMHKTLGVTFHYAFEDDFAWMGYVEQIPEKPLPYIKQ